MGRGSTDDVPPHRIAAADAMMGRLGRQTPFHPDLRRFARVVPSWPTVGPRVLRALRPLERAQRRRLPDDVGREVLGEVSVRIHRPPGFGPVRPALSPARSEGLVAPPWVR